MEQVRKDLRDLKHDLKTDFNNQLENVNSTLKDLATATKELIRVDGDVRVLREAVGRIGKESDDHEKRLRLLEGKPGRRYDKVIDRLITVAIGAGVGFIISHLVGT